MNSTEILDIGTSAGSVFFERMCLIRIAAFSVLGLYFFGFRKVRLSRRLFWLLTSGMFFGMFSGMFFVGQFEVNYFGFDF